MLVCYSESTRFQCSDFSPVSDLGITLKFGIGCIALTILVSQAKVCLSRRRFDDARLSLLQAIAVGPDNAENFLLLVDLCEKKDAKLEMEILDRETIQNLYVEAKPEYKSVGSKAVLII